jgi:hypothetical protein
MLKAMYGCVQASALWYALICYEIEKMNYLASETDNCVFVKQVGERLFVLLLHVDDILRIVDAEEAKHLGMKIAIKDEGTVVDMSFYVAQILEGEEVEVVASPTTKTTYNVDEKAQRLGEEERKWSHSKTAKLLYLSKRARPDILTAVILLCTRV